MKCLNEFSQPVGLPLPDWRPLAAPTRQPMQGRFCRLEPLDPVRHGAELSAANALDEDDSAWTYLPYGPFPDTAGYLYWLEQQAALQDPLFFTIIDLAQNRAVGLASYLRIDAAVGVIEVGHLKFSRLLQKTPAATEAMFLMAEAAFAQGYRRYEWKCDALNAPSRAAAERLGFTFEGIFRQARVVKGRNRDTAWYSIIDSEWPTLEAAFRTWLAPTNFDADQRQIRSLHEVRLGA